MRTRTTWADDAGDTERLDPAQTTRIGRAYPPPAALPAPPARGPSPAPDPSSSSGPDRRPGDLWRTVARGLGQTLVTAGLVVLLFVVYEVYVTDVFADHRQGAVADDLRSSWHGDDPTVGPARGPLAEVPLGDGFAFIRIPRLGSDYVRAIVEGSGQEQLAEGPGHYTGTAMPGQPGNFAVAGHRVGTGSPFLDLDRLRPGDPIVVETADSWFTYRVLGDATTGDFAGDPSGIPGQEIVTPRQVEVINPTPDAAPGVPASGAYLTLTTCHPKYSARQRLVVHARLDGGPVAKSAAPDGPPALTGD